LDEFSVTFYTRPDCELNGEQHNFWPHLLKNGQTHTFCSVCGKYGSEVPKPDQAGAVVTNPA
jgi:hypothetical protein